MYAYFFYKCLLIAHHNRYLWNHTMCKYTFLEILISINNTYEISIEFNCSCYVLNITYIDCNHSIYIIALISYH